MCPERRRGQETDEINALLSLEVLGIKISAKLMYFPPEGGVGLVPKRGCVLTLAYYAFPR
jgi:hypothetical protein